MQAQQAEEMTAGCAFFGKIRICPDGGNAGIPESSEKWYEIRQMLYNIDIAANCGRRLVT